MIEEHKQKLLSRLELACARQRSNISAKIQETARAKDSLSRTAGFLSHLRRLGRADEIVVSYGSVVDFYRRLVNSSSYAGDTDRPTGGGKPATGSSDELRTADSAKRSSTACPALTTRLACVFTAGPCTETNIGILLGPLDLHKVPLNAEDSPQVSVRFVSFNFFSSLSLTIQNNHSHCAIVNVKGDLKGECQYSVLLLKHFL